MFGKLQSVNFPSVNNISKFHENWRQKSSAGVGGLIDLSILLMYCILYSIQYAVEWDNIVGFNSSAKSRGYLGPTYHFFVLSVKNKLKKTWKIT